MTNNTRDDNRKLAEAEALIKDARDPSWPEDIYSDTAAIELWDWAESKGLTNIQAGLARLTTGALAIRDRGKGAAKWLGRLKTLASQAKKAGRLEEYAGFVEAMLPIHTLDRDERQALHQELYELYKQLDHRKFAVWHAAVLAGYQMRAGEHILAGDLLIWAYRTSDSLGFQKGVIRTFIEIGRLLGEKSPVLACRFLYTARELSAKIRSKFGITALEQLRAIRHMHVIDSQEYEADLPNEQLISELETMVAGWKS